MTHRLSGAKPSSEIYLQPLSFIIIYLSTVKISLQGYLLSWRLFDFKSILMHSRARSTWFHRLPKHMSVTSLIWLLIVCWQLWWGCKYREGVTLCTELPPWLTSYIYLMKKIIFVMFHKPHKIQPPHLVYWKTLTQTEYMPNLTKFNYMKFEL